MVSYEFYIFSLIVLIRLDFVPCAFLLLKVTQMKYRLSEGEGRCHYYIGEFAWIVHCNQRVSNQQQSLSCHRLIGIA